MAVGTVLSGLRVQSVTPRMATLAPVARDINVSIPEMVSVPGGTFSMGSARFSDAQPIRQVTLSDFAIGKYPVTNGDYRGYLEATGKNIPALVADEALAMHPVVNASWNEAVSYCKFLMEITGRKFGLLTEAQWEFAAKGVEGRDYPWGNESYEGRVSFNSKGTKPVDAHPKGATPSGIFDMSGNVWEWCADWYGEYKDDNLTDPEGPKSGTYRVLRGGSWYSSPSDGLLSVYRYYTVPENQNDVIGFRLAEDLR